MNKTREVLGIEHIPEESRRLTARRIDIAKQLRHYIKESRQSKRDFAISIGMKPSYLSRILAARENLTLRTIAKLEAAIGRDLITTPLLEDIKGKAASHLSEYIEAERGFIPAARTVEIYSGRIIPGIPATQRVLSIEPGDDIMTTWLKATRECDIGGESFKVLSEERRELPKESKMAYA